LQVVEGHGSLLRWDLYWKFGLRVAGGFSYELLKFLLGAEAEFFTFEVDDKECVSNLELLLVCEGHWAVVEERLLSVRDFRGFVAHHSARSVPF
jgi:hypothetical protein